MLPTQIRVVMLPAVIASLGVRRHLSMRQYFQLIWAGLGRADRAAARKLVESGQPYAGGQSPPSLTARALSTLEDLGFAHRVGPRRWAVAEPMFADWLRRS